MIKYEELIPNITEQQMRDKRELEQHTPNKLNLNNADDKWLVVAYSYAKNNQLKSYQARSFASELALLLTHRVYDTDVSLIYNEPNLDSHLYKKFNEIGDPHRFVEYMLKFYKSSDSWKYEHISKYLQFRLTEDERAMFYNIPIPKPKQKFLHLLDNFDYEVGGVEYKREGELSTYFAINLTPSEHSKFMTVAGGTKTDKFLNLLYFYYQKKQG